MKRNTFIYWVSTGLLTFMMLFSAYSYLTNPDMKSAFVHLGFPDYFRVELGIVKILGALALLLTMVPRQLKDLAYFGFALTFISAIIAHISSGDPFVMATMPFLFLAVLAVSYFTRSAAGKPALNGKAGLA